MTSRTTCRTTTKMTSLLLVLGTVAAIGGNFAVLSTPVQSAEFESCSKSCGGGVQAKLETICSSTDGRNASCSPVKSYIFCNTQECPEDGGNYQDLRREQCSQNDALYAWKPVIDDANKCALYCMATGNDGERFYRMFADRVVDGTPCDQTGSSVCVGGECLSIWCDGKIGKTGKQNDACLNCGGDGRGCVTKHGVIDTNQLPLGYYALVTIPVGATSVTVREDAVSSNYLAVRSEIHEYYLNGDNEITPDAEPVEMGGTTFEYHRLQSGIEYLSALGPLTEPLVFEIVKRTARSASVIYDYSLPSDDVTNVTYRWAVTSWSACNASCGEAWLNRDVTCINSETGEVVDANHCSGELKPTSRQMCDHVTCTGRWKTGEWNPCTATCGRGNQTRSVACEEDNAGGPEHVDTFLCDSRYRPTAVRDCKASMPCHRWTSGTWSRCNQICGAGEQTRRVQCSARQNNTEGLSGVLSDSFCDVTARPAARQSCNAGPCGGAEWLTSEWSGCQCKETEDRRSLCVSREGQVVEEARCDPTKRPNESRACPPIDHSECQSSFAGQWFTSQWKKCSAKCGSGVQRRHVFCGTMRDDDEVSLLPSGECDGTARPSDEQECYGQRCTGQWFTAPFAKCSVTCGGGKRHRTLMCFVNGTKATPSECDSNARPEATEDCNQQPCDDDNLLLVSDTKCLKSTHGCCPEGITAADGPGQLGCVASGDPIPIGLCIETEFGCCLDGVTAAQGPFKAGCQTPSCKQTQYGCCEDGQTAASGLHYDGCPQTSSRPLDSGTEEPEAFTDRPAVGTTTSGGSQGVTEVVEETIVAVTAQLQKIGCSGSDYGCCGDDVTPREGPNGEGCADYEVPDEGSGSVESCEMSEFGCCPDRVSPSSGPDGEGCEDLAPTPGDVVDVEDEETLVGCDKTAQGENSEGCPDNEETTVVVEQTPVREDGEDEEAGCDRTEYGCCIDGKIAATGPMFEGCTGEDDRLYEETCVDEPYGCCPDGVTSALGPELAGCGHRMQTAAACSMPKEPGQCSNFTISWYYDVAYGDCTRFWYGGCDGNENRFESKEECRNRCVSPPDSIDRCFLPRTVGRCRGAGYRYYYNWQTSQCEEFIYGGCLGNDNRFNSMDDCQRSCIEPQKPNTCRQPVQRGPCRGSFSRWHFDHERDACVRFTYGGCLGNDNNFNSLEECESRCATSAAEICTMEKDPGPCQAEFYRWYFDAATQQCHEFVYSGCQGNKNRFVSRAECEQTCDKLIPRKSVDRCKFPRDTGTCSSYYERWYFDTSDSYCKQFVYGGCGGNENRFDSEPACREACDANPPIDICLLPVEVTTRCAKATDHHSSYYFDGQLGQCVPYASGGCGANANKFDSMESCRKKCSAHLSVSVPDTTTTERCQLPRDPGPCLAAMMRWHYSPLEGRCVRFEYGGCGGNRNRFLTEDICNRQCRFVTQTTEAQTEVDETESTTAAVDLSTTPRKQRTTSTKMTTTDVTIETTRQEEEFTTTSTSTDEDEDVPAITVVCRLTHDAGSCTTYQHQWYFEEATQTCKRFLYGGCGGNENRFETQDDCERRCSPQEACSQPADAGHCLEYIPMFYYDRVTDRCLQFVFGGCGGNENKFQTRESCEQRCRIKREEVTGLAVCSLRSEPGPCREFVVSWYYDHELGECADFTYGGCEGNGNRFTTKEDCQQSCQVADICRQSADTGPCRSSKARFFYDVASGDCRQFTYGGCKGNANRFLTLDNCRRTCSGVEQLAPSGERLENTTPALATTRTTKHWKISKPKTTTARTTTTDSLAFTESDTAGDICWLPSDTGSCTDRISAYFFDPLFAQCFHFFWSGCGGNANRFQTLDDCEQRCVNVNTIQPDTETESAEEATEQPTRQLTTPQSVDNEGDGGDVCTLERDTGPCVDYTIVWYFEPDTGTCRRFYYGGCEGNGNKFNTSEECESRCLRREHVVTTTVAAETVAAVTETVAETRQAPTDAPTTPETDVDRQDDDSVKDVVDEDPDTVCHLAVDEGDYCTGWELSWHYDADAAECKPFYYGGCAGNGNRFESEEACENVCMGVVPAETTEPVEPTEPTEPEGPEDPVEPTEAEEPVVPTEPAEPDVEVDPTEDAFYGDICSLPVAIGSCDGDLERWYWDQLTESCERFLFSGCEGNENNFETETDCSEICGVELPDLEIDTTEPPVTPPVEDEEEAPIISEPEQEINAVISHDVIIPCTARGSPQPEITWFRNGQPLVLGEHGQRRLSVASDGSLNIAASQSRDAATYTCLAFNNVGRATRLMRLVVNVPGEIEDSDRVVQVSASLDDTVQLPCVVTGSPMPTVHWTHDGKDVIVDSRRVTQLVGALEISNVRVDDEGEYVCEAWNGFGQPRRKQIVLTVEDSLTVSVRLENDTEEFTSGETFALACVSESSSDGVELTWYKDGHMLWLTDDRIRTTSSKSGKAESATSHLIISDASTDDSGEYSCTVAKGRKTVTSSTVVVQVQEPKTTTKSPSAPAVCVDKPWYANCNLIVEAQLCHHAYFSVFCCKTCRDAGLLA